MLLHAENLSKAYTDKPLFTDISFTIEQGEKTALIGVNGCGKSTLLKILAGAETSDTGEIQKGKDLRIHALPQNPVFEKDTIWEEMIFQNQKNRYPLEEYELKSILTRLDLQDLNAVIEDLSGGQRRKVSLAIALATDADLLLLDEPTNHLDNDMIAWLEGYLAKYKGAVFMITHDRYFLERVCSRILELDHGNIYEHKGDYEAYLQDKQERTEALNEAAQKHRNLYRKELEWVRAGVQARGTKAKYRLDQFEKLRQQRFDLQEQKLELLAVSQRMGKKTLEWQDLAFGYDKNEPLFTGFSYRCKKHDRIGLVGPNGCGKSTFLKLLAGELAPDSGIIDIGPTVKIGYFRQDHEMEDMSMRVIDYIEEKAKVIQTEKGQVSAGTMLERFLFDKDKHYLTLDRLSGGERRRLYLLRILMEAPNLLLLDEPTNDLDLITLEVLEDYLDEFTGIVILVSHDRYFLDRVCDYLFVWQPDRTWKSYIGGYSDLLVWRKEEKQAAPASTLANTKPKTETRKKGLGYFEKKELEILPDTIDTLQQQVDALEAAMEGLSDFAKLSKICQERDEAAAKLEEAENRWLELSEKAES